MKVLHIAHYFLPHMAAGVTTREIIKMHLQKGHEVTLIAPSTYFSDNSGMLHHSNRLRLKCAFTAIPEWLALRSKFASLLVATLGYLSVFIAGVRTLRREGPFNVILVQHHPYHLASLTSYFLSILTRVPLVINVHDVMPSPIPPKSRIKLAYDVMSSKLNQVAFSHADRILCSSSEAVTILINSGLKENRMVVFPNTVDLNLFSPTQLVEKSRNRLGIIDKKVILFMASAFEDRGLDVLLKALRIIKDEPIVLLVVGPCDRESKELAQELGVHSRIFFAGRVDYRLVPAYIQMAGVCVGPLIASPYTYGTVPRKVIEYMACGKPVIIARGAVTEDLVVDRISAIEVDSGDEDDVAGAIMLLTNNDGLAEAVGKQAQRTIAERYSTGKLANTLDETLMKLACSQAPR